MARFVRFTDVFVSPRGEVDQSIYINPDHVRIVRKDSEHGGGTVIGLVGYDVPVREDLEQVIGMLSSAQRP